MLNLRDREWNAFPLTEIFVIKAGKRLTKSDMSVGKRPFIGATEYGNGITNWVSNTNVSLDSDLLGVNYNGSVVETFYHPYECIFSDDVKRFRLKGRKGNRLVYLFLKTTIIQQTCYNIKCVYEHSTYFIAAKPSVAGLLQGCERNEPQKG